MTIIVYRDGQCWADDLLWDDGTLVGRENKIKYRKKDGAIISACGDAAQCELFLQLAMANKKLPADNGTDSEGRCTGVIYFKDGTIHMYNGPRPFKLDASFHALGSGSEIAIGAMLAGADAKEACRIVCQAKSWAASLTGVDHEGTWAGLDVQDVLEAMHYDHAPGRM